MSDTEFRFPPVTKDPDETRSVVLSFYSMCANRWRRNESFDLNEHMRPTRPTGFAYKVTIAGTSGAREPTWPTVLGQTVINGSVTLECVAAGQNGLHPITNIEVLADTGFSAGTPVVNESVKVLVDYTGGVDDQDYEVKYTPTVNGKPRVARQLVKVRKQ